jgi:hypothetical protein
MANACSRWLKHGENLCHLHHGLLPGKEREAGRSERKKREKGEMKRRREKNTERWRESESESESERERERERETRGGLQVLLNLLVAMLNNTFEDNRRDAQQSWKLHRAALLLRIDRSMTKDQRCADDKQYWQMSADDRCHNPQTHFSSLPHLGHSLLLPLKSLFSPIPRSLFPKNKYLIFNF